MPSKCINPETVACKRLVERILKTNGIEDETKVSAWLQAFSGLPKSKFYRSLIFANRYSYIGYFAMSYNLKILNATSETLPEIIKNPSVPEYFDNSELPEYFVEKLESIVEKEILALDILIESSDPKPSMKKLFSARKQIIEVYPEFRIPEYFNERYKSQVCGYELDELLLKIIQNKSPVSEPITRSILIKYRNEARIIKHIIDSQNTA